MRPSQTSTLFFDRLGLVNARSLANKTFILNDFFTSPHLDFLLVTETWACSLNLSLQTVTSSTLLRQAAGVVVQPQFIKTASHKCGHPLDLVLSAVLTLCDTEIC